MQFIIQFLFAISILGFLTNLITGYLQLGNASLFPFHLVVGLGSTFIGVLVTQMSTSYYLATRDRLIEEDRVNKIPPEIIEEAKGIKKNLFASCGPAMLLILFNTVLGGCAYVKIIPSLPHHVLAYLVIMCQIRAFRATLHFHHFRKKLVVESP